MSKKAIASYVVIIWSWLVFIALALFFVLLFSLSLKGCGRHAAVQEITGAATEKTTADITLLNYMRTPAEFNGKKVTISDLIYQDATEEFKNNDIKKAIDNKTKEIFADFEYCFKTPGVSDFMVKGACIFISDELPVEKDSRATARSKLYKYDMNFCTPNFYFDYADINSTVALPIKGPKTVYASLYYTHVNSALKKCPRYLS